MHFFLIPRATAAFSVELDHGLLNDIFEERAQLKSLPNHVEGRQPAHLIVANNVQGLPRPSARAVRPF